ncbi:SirB1 family protein [Sphingomonas sp. DBB INV C78]|uniref:SirB1 family protein n=1 Tax=Sphingomonas sp. DBB INV C78 TaxID=3349434 RepID=UPI0036D26B19
MNDEAIELDVAALELSALDHPGTDLGAYLSLFDDIAAALVSEGPNAQTGEAQATALQTVFYERFQFTGDRDAYDAVINADMIRVMDRRRGLPVSLSILYVAQARRMGWSAYPIDLPGHVLVRVGPSNDTLLLDPFHDGRRFAVEQLAAMIGKIVASGHEPPNIAPMSNRAVLMRLVMNQASRAEQDGDLERAIICIERMIQLGPLFPHPRWELVRLQLRAGLFDGARATLLALLGLNPTNEARERIMTALAGLRRTSSDDN